jgi:hypothetical protein
VLQEAIRLEQVGADVAEMEIKDEAMARENGPGEANYYFAVFEKSR